jgi:uncharacterized protein YukE
MAKAIVDPDELDRFAAALKQFNADLHDRLGLIARHFNHLGESWRDQEQERFAEEFQGMLVVMQRFSALCEQQGPLLQRKAHAIRSYLSQR